MIRRRSADCISGDVFSRPTKAGMFLFFTPQSVSLLMLFYTFVAYLTGSGSKASINDKITSL